MAFLHRSPKRRWLLTAGLALALVVLVVVLAGSGRAATGSRCSDTVTAGKPSGIQLRAYALRAGRVSCGRARAIVADYLHKKIRPSDQERCASQAENPGPGCRIDGYLCHSAGRVRLAHGLSIHPEACRQASRRIGFTESDHTRG